MKKTIDDYRNRLQDEKKAKKYANRFEQGSRKRIDEREQRAVRKIFSSLKDCRTILDVPSGAGRFLPSLGEQGRRTLEMDAAAEILQFARARAEKLKAPAAFAQADASRLPLANDAVDAVFCNRLIHHLVLPEERAVILRELRRVARRYVVVSFFDYHSFGVLRKLLKAFKGSKPQYNKQPTLEQFEKEVIACGFRVLSLVPTGAVWVSQKYFVLEKKRDAGE